MNIGFTGDLASGRLDTGVEGELISSAVGEVVLRGEDQNIVRHTKDTWSGRLKDKVSLGGFEFNRLVKDYEDRSGNRDKLGFV